MLDIATAYNRYKFIGFEFLSWLWFTMENNPAALKTDDVDFTSIGLGNRIVLENFTKDRSETITIKGDEPNLEAARLSLRNGALVGAYPTEALPRLELVARMIGRDAGEVEAMSRPTVLATLSMCSSKTSSMPAFCTIPPNAKAQNAIRVTCIMETMPPRVSSLSTMVSPVAASNPCTIDLTAVAMSRSWMKMASNAAMAAENSIPGMTGFLRMAKYSVMTSGTSSAQLN